MEPADLTAFGLIPEFVGRFPLVVNTRALDEAEMVRVLTEPKNSLVRQFKYLLALSGVALHVSPEALKAIASIALSKKTGARGLRTIFERVLLETMFIVSSQEAREGAVTGVFLDEAAARGLRPPLLVRHPATLAALVEDAGVSLHEIEGVEVARLSAEYLAA